MEIKNKTIVNTGASKGLGRALALYFCQQNPDLILVARNEALLLQVQQEIKMRTGIAPCIIKCDISSESDVDRLALEIQEKTEHIDILINNAGIGTYRVSEQLSNHEMRNHFEVNFFGVFYCIKALLPLIKASRSGYILNIGSLFSRIALAQNSIYAATKFALAGFSEGLRRELQPLGIGVGLFSPGAMKTSFQDNRSKEALNTPKFMVLDPKKVAIVIEKMIQQQKKEVVLSNWMLLALRLKYR